MKKFKSMVKHNIFHKGDALNDFTSIKYFETCDHQTIH